MTKKIIIEHRDQGRSHGCLMFFAWAIVICVAITVLAYVGVIAAGVGLWFLIRYIWRQYVQQKPESGIVQRGLKMAPITRKILAAVPCVIVSLCLCGVVTSMGKHSQTNNVTDHAQEQATASDDQKVTSADNLNSTENNDNESSEQSSAPAFNPNSYYLKVEVTEPTAGQYKAIVSVYGSSDADFSTMRQCVMDAAAHYEMAEDADTIGAEFDSIIGTEGGSGITWADGGVITSAPNESENFYRADLYVKR